MRKELKKLPGTVLIKINQKVGFRLLTKFGEKGTVDLVKFVPVAGGIIGGSVDFVGTKVIAKRRTIPLYWERLTNGVYGAQKIIKGHKQVLS